MEEGIPVLAWEGVQGDRELLREEINRLGYALRGNSQFDVDIFAESQFKGPPTIDPTFSEALP